MSIFLQSFRVAISKVAPDGNPMGVFRFCFFQSRVLQHKKLFEERIKFGQGGTLKNLLIKPKHVEKLPTRSR
jgi:hypothetical protein